MGSGPEASSSWSPSSEQWPSPTACSMHHLEEHSRTQGEPSARLDSRTGGNYKCIGIRGEKHKVGKANLLGLLGNVVHDRGRFPELVEQLEVLGTGGLNGEKARAVRRTDGIEGGKQGKVGELHGEEEE